MTNSRLQEVDYLKLDNCGSCPNESYPTALKHYTAMGAALNATGRPIFYMSEFGTEYGIPPGGHAGPHVGPGNDSAIAPQIFNTDRIGRDIAPNWGAVLELIDDDQPHAPHARPGFFNDVEMLEVGNGMTLAQDESHFAMWCVLAAPLIVGCDLTAMTPDTLRILTAKGPVAVDQDPLGVQGTICWQSSDKALQVYRRPLSDGSVAVVALNRGAGAAEQQQPWVGPINKIFAQGACRFKGNDAFGDNTTTAAQCQAGAIKSGANAINYNTDPGAAVGPRCRMQHCDSPQAPTESHLPWVSWTAFETPPAGGVNITIDLESCGHGSGGTTTVEDVWTGKTVAAVTGASGYTVTGIGPYGHAFLRLSKSGSGSRSIGDDNGAGRLRQRAHRRCLRTNSAIERVALACPVGQRITEVAASWGAPGSGSGVCNSGTDGIGAAESQGEAPAVVDPGSTRTVSRHCDGEQSCSFVASDRLFAPTTPAPDGGSRLSTSFGCR